MLVEKNKNEHKLDSIEGKQKLVGRDTGTEWEIDAKGVVEGGDGIVLIECRRYTTSKQNQEKIAAIAYRIYDTKAKGGIMVSPPGLQAGAKKGCRCKQHKKHRNGRKFNTRKFHDAILELIIHVNNR